MTSCIAITYSMQEKNNEQENMKIEINGEYIHGCANECCLSFMSCVVVCLNWWKKLVWEFKLSSYLKF